MCERLQLRLRVTINKVFSSHLGCLYALRSHLADSEMTQIVHQSSLERDALANINQLNVVALHEPN